MLVIYLIESIGEFVEVSLSPHFGPLISFVNECEPLVNQQATNLLVRYNGQLSLMSPMPAMTEYFPVIVELLNMYVFPFRQANIGDSVLLCQLETIDRWNQWGDRQVIH